MIIYGSSEFRVRDADSLLSFPSRSAEAWERDNVIMA